MNEPSGNPSGGPEQSTRLIDRLHPKNWSPLTSTITAATTAAVALCLAGYLAISYGRYSLWGEIQQIALAGEPPATNLEVDEVLKRTRSLVGYLEIIEAGPDGIIVKSTACDPLQLPPDPDLLLDPSASTRATGLAMHCPTLGQGKVSERGVEVKSGPALVSAGWKISSGAEPRAVASLAVGTNGFKIGTSGVKAGSTNNDASVACMAGLDGSFDCDLDKGGKASKLKVAADKGRALLVWIGDKIIKPRLETIRKKGVVTGSK